MSVPKWTANITDCPAIQYTIDSETTTTATQASQFISFSSTGSNLAFSITSRARNRVGTYTLSIRGKIVSASDNTLIYRESVQTYTFEVLSCANSAITTQSFAAGL